MFRASPRWIAALWLMMASMSADELGQKWIRGMYTDGSPRPIQVSEPEAWQRAAQIAEDTPRAFVLAGSGQSMQPLYSPGTILVLQQVPYAELKRGQTVLYRNKARKVVAHVLVAKVRDGWRAQGLNNQAHDMEPVCEENLVGIVVAAFRPVGRTPMLAIAAVPVAGAPVLH